MYGVTLQFKDNGGTEVGSVNPLPVTQGAAIGQPNSATSGYVRAVRFGGVAHNLHGTGSITLSGSTIGTAGVASDTMITAILILKNAGPGTVTLTNFLQNEDNATAKTLLLSGSSTVDTLYTFDQLINYAGAASIQASVADTVVVWHGNP